MRRTYSVEEFRIKEILELLDDGGMDTETAYQRNLVWDPKKKSFLIDSLSRGLPIGMITLFSYLDDDGNEVYEVVDGKQRVTTIQEFTKGDFELEQELDVDGPTVLRAEEEVVESDDEGDAEAEDEVEELLSVAIGQTQRDKLAGKFWKEIPAPVQKGFKSLSIPAFVVRAKERALAVDIFMRMNVNTVGLSAQEIRNAVYNRSELLKVAAAVASNVTGGKSAPPGPSAWWTESGFMTKRRINRQTDVEFVLELLVMSLSGGPTHRRDDLDVQCGQYTTRSPAKTRKLNASQKEVEESFQKLILLLPGKFKFHAFSTQVEHDVYALVGALMKYRKGKDFLRKNAPRYTAALSLFRLAVTTRLQVRRGKLTEERAAEILGPTDEFIELADEYAATFTGGQINGLSQRTTRIAAWTKVLEGVAPQNDKKRLFTTIDRHLIWAAGPTPKICAKCGAEVTFDNWHAGHVHDHWDAGRTTLENGQIECTGCSQSGVRSES